MTAEAMVKMNIVPGPVSPDDVAFHCPEPASSWTQAGYLHGKVKKGRVNPRVTPFVAAYAMLLGYLSVCGANCCWTANELASWTARSPI